MFRVSVRGKFNGLDEPQRTRLKGESAEHGLAFTEAGTFTFDASFAVFNFRIAVPSAEGDDDAVASKLALDALRGYGYPHQVLKVAVTDMREIKVNRKGR